MIALALAFAITTTASRGDYPPDAACGAGTTLEMAECGRQQAIVWEDRRKHEFNAALERAPTEARAHLEQAEQLWLEFRDANCAVYADHDGTIRALLAIGCRRDMTKARTLELRSLDW